MQDVVQVVFRTVCWVAIAMVAIGPSACSAKGWVYFVEEGIYRTDLAGASLEVVEPLTQDSGFDGIAVDSTTGWFYWTERSPQTATTQVIGRDFAGKQERIIASALYQNEYNAVSVDETNGKIYWTSAANGGSILRTNLDASDQEIVATGAGPNLTGLALDSIRRKVYWITRDSNQTAGKIRRAGFDNPSIEDIVPNLVDPRGIALDAGRQVLFWSDAGIGKIQRSDLSGGNIEDVLSEAGHPYGIAFSSRENMLYWVDPYAGTMSKARTDGSSVYVLRSRLLSPLCVDVWIPPTVDTQDREHRRGLWIAPNPFDSLTWITYALTANDGPARLAIYDARGRVITILYNRSRSQRGTIPWTGRDDRGGTLNQGLYFLRLETAGGGITRKILRISGSNDKP